MRKRIYVITVLILALIAIFFHSVEITPLVPEDGTSFATATVLEVEEEDLQADGDLTGSQEVLLLITSGSHKGEKIEAGNMVGYLYGAYCEVGTKVVVRLSEYDGVTSGSVYNYNREVPELVMVLLLFGSIILVGGKKGVHSSAALLFTFVVIIGMYLPMLYIGVSPFLAATVSVILITIVSILLIGDCSRKSIGAMMGTICGVVIAGMIASLFGQIAHINGMNVDCIETLVYISQNTKLQVSGVLFSGILISSLGAVMDVAMSVASALTEVYEHNRNLSVKDLFWSGMHVGRDMIGTMSNTLILAYVGTSVNTLLIIYAYSYQMHQFLNMYSIGIEIMQSLSGTLGVIFTVPFVSIIMAYLLKKQQGN